MSAIPARDTDHGGAEECLRHFELGVPVSRWYVALCTAALCLVASTEGRAQVGDIRLRGFADIGSEGFTAEKSFVAVLGSARGRIVGVGVDAVLPQRIFANLRTSRFRGTGQRVFLFGGEQFNLGVPTTITVVPVEITGGYRFDFPRHLGRRLVPYGGAGVGWHRYEETSQFAEASEDVSRRFTGYHVVGGAEVRLTRWIGAAGEAQWTTVPNAFGDDPNGVSHELDESNLGGVTLRLKIVIGH